MKKNKEAVIAERKLIEAMYEGIKNLSDENLQLVYKLNKLVETLEMFDKYKIIGLSSVVEKYGKRLKSFEGLIDKKYWKVDALQYIVMIISCGAADTLKEAIAEYEKYKKCKNNFCY